MRLDSFDREFIGIFMGEGCIDISQQGRMAHHIRPRVRIGMHGRERMMLEMIQQRYGGSLTVRPTDGSVTWQLTGADKLRRVCEILSRSTMPSAKRDEIPLLREAIELVGRPDRMLELKRALAEMKH